MGQAGGHMESCCRSNNVIPKKSYGSEKMLFDAPKVPPSFRYMNGYGSEDVNTIIQWRQKGSLNYRIYNPNTSACQAGRNTRTCSFTLYLLHLLCNRCRCDIGMCYKRW